MSEVGREEGGVVKVCSHYHTRPCTKSHHDVPLPHVVKRKS